MRHIEIYMERPQKIGVCSRIDAARNVAGDRAAPFAPAEGRLQHRLAQSLHGAVDVVVSRLFEARRELDGASLEILPRQVAINTERFERGERLDAVPGRDPRRHAEGKAVHQEGGKEVPAHRRFDFLGD